MGLLITGCAGIWVETRYRNREESKTIVCQYTEKLHIQTEPSGARIYIKDEFKGISPITINMPSIQFGITHNGYYRAAYDFDQLAAGYWDRNERRVSDTELSSVEINNFKYSYTIKAFKEEYLSSEEQVYVDEQDVVFQSSIRNLFDVTKFGEMPTTHFVGKRHLLLALTHQPEHPIQKPHQQPQQQQQQQQQQTIVIPDSGSSASTERGMVMVSTTPENAEIYADGAFVGNAPANLKLSAGIHIIEVKKSGFQSYRKELRVLNQSELSLRVTLEKE